MPHRGYLCLVLHAHLPYVRHPEHESFLEEAWLFEAMTESYLPFVRVLDRLIADGIAFRLTLSLSPPLITMLQDPFLQQRYRAHLAKLRTLAESEVHRTDNDRRLQALARMYQGLLEETHHTFEERCRGNLIGAFKGFQQAGFLEIITTAATHGYLPLLRVEPAAVRAQVLIASEFYQKVFGRPSPGFWLPECGFYPGLEQVLGEAGAWYFFVDTHGLTQASQRPRHGTLAPVACPNGVAAFGRDHESSKQVWSAEEGYPGDPWYREFYRDLGFDLDFDYIKPYLLDGTTRIHTGFKYHRITGKTLHKELYDPVTARDRIGHHAQDFLNRRARAIGQAAVQMDHPPLFVCPYDAELFGHWWFEGPQWLDALIRKAAGDYRDVIELVTPSQYLHRHSALQCAVPSASSWGDKGYNEVWLNDQNDWIYPHLHRAARQMQHLAQQHADAPPGSLTRRTVQQAARSLLLAQASDWAFIMKSGTTVDFARDRTRDHLARFNYLADTLRVGRLDEWRLRGLEFMDNIFPDLNYGVFA